MAPKYLRGLVDHSLGKSLASALVFRDCHHAACVGVRKTVKGVGLLFTRGIVGVSMKPSCLSWRSAARVSCGV